MVLVRCEFVLQNISSFFKLIVKKDRVGYWGIALKERMHF